MYKGGSAFTKVSHMGRRKDGIKTVTRDVELGNDEGETGENK
jgi:hypothetical protein